MKDFKLKAEVEFIDLCDLLKAAGLTESGGEAKHHIAQGEVKVNGEMETRKRRKIRRGDSVEFSGQLLKIL